MDAVDRSFPDQVANVRRLKKSDPVFAEICRDYALLKGLLPCDAADPGLGDINDSLAALEQEIRSFLGQSLPRASQAS